MKNFINLLSTLVAVHLALVGFGQISVTPENDATTLANNLIGSESSVTVVSATFTGADGSAGTFTGGDFGINEGILLTSGSAETAVGPNIDDGASGGGIAAGDSNLDALIAPLTTNDACVLTITFVPDGNSLEFSYVFASEEYNEYVCSEFNDVFAFFVNGGIYSNQNIALIPGTNPPMPVAINNVNNGTVGSEGSSDNCSDLQLANSAFYIDNTGGTNIEYDGYTTTLTAVIAVVPGTEYTIKLAIADAEDHVLDSGVFLEGQSFVSVTCDAGDVNADPNSPYCPDNIPESITPTHTSDDGVNDAYVYAVSDETGSILAVVDDGDSFNPQGWDPDTYYIYGMSYSGTLFGVEVGGNVQNVSSDGCFDMSDPATFEILESCDEFECPDLGANIGDACDDGDPDTENDMVTDNCVCAGTPIEYDCPELGANIGDACDDGNPDTENDMVTDNCVCAGTPIEYDCPELGGNIGDPCPLSDNPGLIASNFGSGTSMGVIGPNCNCIPPQVNTCQNWEYFLADYTGGVTTIYRVDLDDVAQTADLTVLKTINYEVHIAYNESDHLLYLIQKSDGSFQTLDVSVVDGALGAPVALSTPLPGSIQAGFAPNGKLIIGSQDSNEFVTVNPITGTTSPYATGDIFGGDMVFDSTGQPYFVTRSSGVFYQLNPGFTNMMIGSVPSTVTGVSVKDDDSFLVSASGYNQLLGRTNGGSPNGAYDLMLNGAAFTASSGDMSSGCAGSNFIGGDCAAFSMFYVNHDATINGSDLYRVQFTPTDAILTFLTNVPFEVHIGFDAMNDIIYMIDKSGTLITAYDPTLDFYYPSVALTPGPSSITAVVFNPNDGMLYIGDDNQNKIYTIDPSNGNTVYVFDAPVSGGDLVMQANTLYLVTKSGSQLYDLTGGVATPVGSIPGAVNGAAQANNNSDIILSNRNTTFFSSIDAATAAPITTYNAMLNGSPFTLLNGDMAAGCADGSNTEECESFEYLYIADNTPGIPQGNVYSGTVSGNDFVLTFLFNAGMSGHIAVNTNNGDIYVVNNNGNNLKTFDASGNLLNNVNIGLSATYALVWNPANGKVYVGSANTNKVYEVDPANGNKLLFASGVPVQGGDLVLNNSGDLFLVERQNNGASHLHNITSGSAVFVADVSTAVNGAALTPTDGFIMAQGANSLSFHVYDGSGVLLNTLNSVDNGGNPFPLYDGDMASGCMDNVQVTPPGTKADVQTTLSSYPNPTTGDSKVVFSSPVDGVTQLDVYDMNGRIVKTLFEQMVKANQEYSIDFDGSSLSNGVYIYRLTDNTGVHIEKFMIAH